jgi:hypothetical protein
MPVKVVEFQCGGGTVYYKEEVIDRYIYHRIKCKAFTISKDS